MPYLPSNTTNVAAFGGFNTSSPLTMPHGNYSSLPFNASNMQHNSSYNLPRVGHVQGLPSNFVHAIGALKATSPERPTFVHAANAQGTGRKAAEKPQNVVQSTSTKPKPFPDPKKNPRDWARRCHYETNADPRCKQQTQSASSGCSIS